MKKIVLSMTVTALMASCTGSSNEEKSDIQMGQPFNYVVDRFADYEILRYEVKAFDQLTLKQKELIYYLSEAALWGRDIFYDQNCKVNLAVKRTLESIYTNYDGDRSTDNFKALETYLKLVWISNGIHRDYSSDKIEPTFSPSFFAEALKSANLEAIGTSAPEVTAAIFDPTLYPKRVNQTAGQDMLLTSAMNYYDGVSQKEAEAFYNALKKPNDQTPPSYGLNSRLVKQNGELKELTWKVGGLYTQSLEKVVYWLEKAALVAENERQQKVIRSLIEYYHTGNLKQFDQYTINWVEDTESMVDFVNGFTESYGDPLGLKASWESIVNYKDLEATKRTELISQNAQWFENQSPIDPRFKKEEVKGVTAKVIVAAMLGGDCYPATPIGINLPNSNWVRRDHGSKSVTISNITNAYGKASEGNGFNEEFMWSNEEIERSKLYGAITGDLHTDLHECLGHGSGKLLPNTSPEALKAYRSPLEETRADLFALYFMADNKMVELGLLPNAEAYKAEYYKYLMNGLMTQLVRITPGKNIEQAHMRNRALIARWVLEQGKSDIVVELTQRDGKTFVKVNSYEKMRQLLGKLLTEVQRIKSEGDYAAGMKLVETYGVKVDPALHNEILERNARLNLASYRGFVNPVYKVERDAEENITHITVEYNEDYTTQNLRYGSSYSSLPTHNNE